MFLKRNALIHFCVISFLNFVRNHVFLQFHNVPGIPLLREPSENSYFFCRPTTWMANCLSVWSFRIAWCLQNNVQKWVLKKFVQNRVQNHAFLAHLWTGNFVKLLKHSFRTKFKIRGWPRWGWAGLAAAAITSLPFDLPAARRAASELVVYSWKFSEK